MRSFPSCQNITACPASKICLITSIAVVCLSTNREIQKSLAIQKFLALVQSPSREESRPTPQSGSVRIAWMTSAGEQPATPCPYMYLAETASKDNCGMLAEEPSSRSEKKTLAIPA